MKSIFFGEAGITDPLLPSLREMALRVLRFAPTMLTFGILACSGIALVEAIDAPGQYPRGAALPVQKGCVSEVISREITPYSTPLITFFSVVGFVGG